MDEQKFQRKGKKNISLSLFDLRICTYNVFVFNAQKKNEASRRESLRRHEYVFFHDTTLFSHLFTQNTQTHTHTDEWRFKPSCLRWINGKNPWKRRTNRKSHLFFSFSLPPKIRPAPQPVGSFENWMKWNQNTTIWFYDVSLYSFLGLLFILLVALRSCGNFCWLSTTESRLNRLKFIQCLEKKLSWSTPHERVHWLYSHYSYLLLDF